MNSPIIYLGFGLTFILAIVAAIISWKVAHYFIARRERYVKSQYEIFFKKLGWSIFWFLLVIYVGIELIRHYLVK